MNHTSRLGDYTIIRTGRQDANAGSENGKYPFFTCSKEVLKIETYAYDCECVLVAGNGNFNVKYHNGKFDAYQRTYIIESVNKEILDVKYLYYYLDSYTERLRQQSVGGVIKYIKLGNLQEVPIPLPPLKTQRRITEILDKTGVLITNRKKQMALLDRLLQSIFISMFGDPVVNTMGWEIKALADITTKIGSGATPRGGKESYKAQGVSLIRSKNIQEGSFAYTQLAFIDDRQAVQLDNSTVEKDDVLLNITGASAGRSCIVPDDILPARVNQHVAIIRLNKTLADSVYINNLLLCSSFQRKLRFIAKTGGATREAITKSQLASLPIPLPPLNLQNRYAKIAENLKGQKKALEQCFLKLEKINKTIMQSLLAEVLSLGNKMHNQP